MVEAGKREDEPADADASAAVPKKSTRKTPSVVEDPVSVTADSPEELRIRARFVPLSFFDGD